MLISVSGKINSGKDLIGEIILYLTDEYYHSKVGEEASFENWRSSNIHSSGYDISHKAMYEVNNTDHFVIKKFADKLKDIICLLINCTREQLEDESFKSKELGEEWWYFKGRNGSLISYSEDSKRNDEDLIKPTPRFLLQFIGTNLLRNQLHPEIWVNALMSEYKLYKETKPFVNSTLKDEDCPNWIITDMRFLNEMEAVKKKDGITIRVNRNLEESKDQHESETELDNAEFDYVIDNNGTIEELIEKVKEILIKEKLI